MQRVMTKPKKDVKKNTLNDLSGKEWIKSTKSWFVLNSSSRGEKKLHPASFPEDIVERFVLFFTKPGQWVVDPFVGSGTTLIVSKKLGRNSIGIDLYDKYVSFAKNRLLCETENFPSKSIVVKGDSRDIVNIHRMLELPKMDFCITSPPYWDQLQKKSERHRIRHQNGYDCKYGDNVLDLGTISDYYTFLEQQQLIFEDLYEVMADRSYLVIITNNVYKNGRLWPLAFDTLKTLSHKWVPKDEAIWCQNDKKLFPFGMFHSYIGNRSHQYCLVFQKML